MPKTPFLTSIKKHYGNVDYYDYMSCFIMCFPGGVYKRIFDKMDIFKELKQCSDGGVKVIAITTYLEKMYEKHLTIHKLENLDDKDEWANEDDYLNYVETILHFATIQHFNKIPNPYLTNEEAIREESIYGVKRPRLTEEENLKQHERRRLFTQLHSEAKEFFKEYFPQEECKDFNKIFNAPSLVQKLIRISLINNWENTSQINMEHACKELQRNQEVVNKVILLNQEAINESIELINKAWNEKI